MSFKFVRVEKSFGILFALVCLLSLGGQYVHAQGTPYYQGKTIRLIVGYSAGSV